MARLVVPRRDYATLLPSKGRPRDLLRMFRGCPMLDSIDTFIGLEQSEETLYATWRKEFPKSRVVWVTNPHRNAGAAREFLRAAACATGRYTRYLVADDDEQVTETALASLISAHAEYTAKHGPCAMSAMHDTYRLYDKDAIALAEMTPSGLRTYEKLSWMLWMIPHDVYKDYHYPTDIGYGDDYHVTMFAILRGLTEWRVCVDAPFRSTRFEFQEGGFGLPAKRIADTGMAITRIAMDYPEWMTKGMIKIRLPFRDMIERVRRRKLLVDKLAQERPMALKGTKNAPKAADVEEFEEDAAETHLYKLTFRRRTAEEGGGSRMRTFVTFGVSEDDAIQRVWNTYAGSSFHKEFSIEGATAEFIIAGVLKIGGN